MSTLAEIQDAAQKLPPQQKAQLIRFLAASSDSDSNRNFPRNLPPEERAAEFKSWAAAHKNGPGLPDSAVGRDAIYD